MGRCPVQKKTRIVPAGKHNRTADDLDTTLLLCIL